MTASKRETELDILRLLAILAVIATHLCGGPVKSLNVDCSEWVFLNCLRASITWDVPVFVMISGYLFLNPNKILSIKDIYKKYIKHLIVCFMVWSAVFQAFYYITNSFSLNWKGILAEYIVGPYPFWYLFMLVGLYMIIPFMRKFTADRRLMEYFILLFILSEFVANYGVALPYVGNIISSVYSKAFFHFTLGFSGYYILGYYLKHYDISFRKEIVLYAAGAVCILFSCVGTTWQSRLQGSYNEWFSKYLMPNVVVESSAIYTLFVKRLSKINFSAKTKEAFKILSDLCFGVYLIHALIIEVLNRFDITVLSFTPVIMIPCLTVLVYSVSLGITFMIRKIPHIGKKIT